MSIVHLESIYGDSTNKMNLLGRYIKNGATAYQLEMLEAGICPSSDVALYPITKMFALKHLGYNSISELTCKINELIKNGAPIRYCQNGDPESIGDIYQGTQDDKFINSSFKTAFGENFIFEGSQDEKHILLSDNAIITIMSNTDNHHEENPCREISVFRKYIAFLNDAVDDIITDYRKAMQSEIDQDDQYIIDLYSSIYSNILIPPEGKCEHISLMYIGKYIINEQPTNIYHYAKIFNYKDIHKIREIFKTESFTPIILGIFSMSNIHKSEQEIYDYLHACKGGGNAVHLTIKEELYTNLFISTVKMSLVQSISIFMQQQLT